MPATIECLFCGQDVLIPSVVEKDDTDYHLVGTREDANNGTSVPIGAPPYTIPATCSNAHRFYGIYTSSGELLVE